MPSILHPLTHARPMERGPQMGLVVLDNEIEVDSAIWALEMSVVGPKCEKFGRRCQCQPKPFGEAEKQC
jgi:hypothetical protein